MENIDYKIIEGSSLRELKELLNSSSQTTAVIGQNAKSSLLLTESGVYAVTLRSSKPEAVKFRVFYTSVVMPEIRRTGSYSPAKRIKFTEDIEEKAKALLACRMDVAALLKCPPYFGMIEAVKTVRKDLGVDYSHLLTGSTIQDDIKDDEVYLEPTELAAELGLLTKSGKGSGIKMNRLLGELELQEKVGKTWVPTEEGEEISQKHSWSVGSKSGYNLKWNLKAVQEIYDDLEDVE